MKIWTVKFNDGGWHSGSLPSYQVVENEISKRSRYIEKLIREDMEKRGKNIEKEF
jgi:hypothetical protein